jgi:amidase
VPRSSTSTFPNFDTISKRVGCGDFQADLNKYFSVHGTNAPYKSLQAVYDSGLYLANVGDRIKRSRGDERGEDRSDHLPHWSNPPRLVGGLKSPAGDNSQRLAPPTGMPPSRFPWVSRMELCLRA